MIYEPRLFLLLFKFCKVLLEFFSNLLYDINDVSSPADVVEDILGSFTETKWLQHLRRIRNIHEYYILLA